MMPTRCQLIRRIELPPRHRLLLNYHFPSSVGGFAMLLAIRLASSGQHPSDVGSVFCLTRIDVSKGLFVGVEDLQAAWSLLDGPWWGKRLIGGCFTVRWSATQWSAERRDYAAFFC